MIPEEIEATSFAQIRPSLEAKFGDKPLFESILESNINLHKVLYQYSVIVLTVLTSFKIIQSILLFLNMSHV